MNLFLQFVLLLFFCGNLLAEDYKDKGTGLTFPEEIAGYKINELEDGSGVVEKFDDPRLGYAIAYSSPKSEVTIYAFNGGAPSIATGVEDKWVKRYFEQAIGEIKFYEKKGYYANLKEHDVGAAFKDLTPKIFLGKKLTYTISIEKPAQDVKSYVFCCGVNNLVFKVRATGLSESDFEEDLTRLLENFSKQIK